MKKAIKRWIHYKPITLSWHILLFCTLCGGLEQHLRSAPPTSLLIIFFPLPSLQRMLASSDPLLRKKKLKIKYRRKQSALKSVKAYPCPFNYLNQPTEILHFYFKSYLTPGQPMWLTMKGNNIKRIKNKKIKTGGWIYSVALTRVEASAKSLTKFDASRQEKLLEEPRP